MVQVNVAAMRRLFRLCCAGCRRRAAAPSECGILRGAAARRALHGGLLCQQGLCGQPDPGSAAQELREKRSPVYVCALCPGPVNTEFNDRAGVVFALKGITPEFCVDEAIHGMLHHKTIIVPSAFMRLCTSAQKLLPTIC